MTPEMNFNQKNRRKFMCMRERERKTYKRDFEKGKKLKRLIYP